MAKCSAYGDMAVEGLSHPSQRLAVEDESGACAKQTLSVCKSMLLSCIAFTLRAPRMMTIILLAIKAMI
jgi:hypothetical protein